MTDAGEADGAEAEKRNGRRFTRTSGVVVTALLVAIASAIGAGIGARALGVFTGEKPLVTASEELQINECGTPLFLDQAHIPPVDTQPSGERSSDSWPEFFRVNDARVAASSLVVASIQGESHRVVTLKRIDFRVERRPRPAGAVFANPCGDGLHGRFVSVDLDRDPPRIVRSNSQPVSEDGTQRPPKPIRFPWTVSVEDPLLLQIDAQTDRCACTWRARIYWASGGRSGVLDIDNGGEGYAVVGAQGLEMYLPQGGGIWKPADFRHP